ncbi:MAG: ferritin-like domain-containing protein, partial [Candidatus Sulfotelmatobacter sp.]
DEAVQIASIADAQAAILRIKSEGEGTEGSPDQPPADGTQFAHYYVFKEILVGKTLVQNGAAWTFSGADIQFPAKIFNFAQSNITPDPSIAFNQALSQLLTELQTCWTSGQQPDIGAMITLKKLGQDLIKQGIRPEFLWGDNAAGSKVTPIRKVG